MQNRYFDLARFWNRRTAVRVRPTASAPVRVQIMGRHSLDFANARDLSVRGIGITVPHGFDPWDIGSEVAVIITLPGQSPFLARGILRHRNEHRGSLHFGIEFTWLPEAARALLEAYVSSREGAREGPP